MKNTSAYDAHQTSQQISFPTKVTYNILKKMIKTADIISIEKLFVGTKQAKCSSFDWWKLQHRA